MGVERLTLLTSLRNSPSLSVHRIAKMLPIWILHNGYVSGKKVEFLSFFFSFEINTNNIPSLNRDDLNDRLKRRKTDKIRKDRSNDLRYTNGYSEIHNHSFDDRVFGFGTIPFMIHKENKD